MPVSATAPLSLQKETDQTLVNFTASHRVLNSSNKTDKTGQFSLCCNFGKAPVSAEAPELSVCRLGKTTQHLLPSYLERYGRQHCMYLYLHIWKLVFVSIIRARCFFIEQFKNLQMFMAHLLKKASYLLGVSGFFRPYMQNHQPGHVTIHRFGASCSCETPLIVPVHFKHYTLMVCLNCSCVYVSQPGYTDLHLCSKTAAWTL